MGGAKSNTTKGFLERVGKLKARFSLLLPVTQDIYHMVLVFTIFIGIFKPENQQEGNGPIGLRAISIICMCMHIASRAVTLKSEPASMIFSFLSLFAAALRGRSRLKGNRRLQ